MNALQSKQARGFYFVTKLLACRTVVLCKLVYDGRKAILHDLMPIVHATDKRFACAVVNGVCVINGRIIFMTEGDQLICREFIAAFRKPDDAIMCMVAGEHSCYDPRWAIGTCDVIREIIKRYLVDLPHDPEMFFHFA